MNKIKTLYLPEGAMYPFDTEEEAKRFLIESKGWTQKQFAHKIGKAERTVRQWLNTDLLSRNHADMPHYLWIEALTME